ncbi:MarR family transcriptional regulator [Hazenella sp. IB182357]|uniref:MarR family transcriptional regulator n=1 Tax=Polycladospora coralii TaxID=2771432 RepID=A0A926NFG0_9BACL|nr:MarR family transcriptional regulator [Polycladospora coralii]MBD1372564.1 MarR family transcriptional regulator [Polycladospora coralii]MBS7531313.1 MarR family transcriptional regulator [Polycladospora coralii]
MMDLQTIFNNYLKLVNAFNLFSGDITRGIEYDMTPSQFNLLEYVKMNQPVMVTQVCQCLDMSLPNVSRELKKIQDKGFIEKKTSHEDRRKVYIHLSESGEKFMENYLTHVKSNFLQHIEGVPEEELIKINGAMEILQYSLHCKSHHSK